jgi:hypothetical protein
MIAGSLNWRVATGLGVAAALLLVAETGDAGTWVSTSVAVGLGGPSAALNTCPADTNADGLVNVSDVLNVLGNWGAGPFDPPGSDTNDDGVVNINDFLSVIADWGPCPWSGPHLGSYSNSGCLPEGDRASPPCEGDDAFEFVVEGDRLSITHLLATYNCCPEDIEVSLAVDEWLLILTEQEILAVPCFCICCYEVESTVEGLAPGEYTVEYWWFDYEADQERCYTDVVVVPGDPT